jgi:hypothetical protein
MASNRKSVFALATLAMVLASAFAVENASAEGRLHGWRSNAAGGVTAGGVHNVTGPLGGQRAGARGIITDGQGNGAAGGVNCARGAAGQACRAGATTWNADGSVNHQSGATVQGANGGSATTQGGFTRNADGAVSGGRNTTATGAQGNTYSGETTYNSADGVSHTATCTDPSGAVIACPTR